MSSALTDSRMSSLFKEKHYLNVYTSILTRYISPTLVNCKLYNTFQSLYINVKTLKMITGIKGKTMLIFCMKHNYNSYHFDLHGNQASAK